MTTAKKYDIPTDLVERDNLKHALLTMRKTRLEVGRDISNIDDFLNAIAVAERTA